MQDFTFTTTPAIVHETGGARRLVDLCRERGARSVLIVTDPGIIRAGLLEDALAIYREAY